MSIYLNKAGRSLSVFVIIIAISLSGCGSNEQSSDSTGGSMENATPVDSGDIAAVEPIDSLPEEMNLKFDCVDGVSFSMSDLRGYAVMVDVWSTRCESCIERFGFMKQLYEKYEPDGFEMIGVAMDQSESDSLRGFVDRYQLPFPVVAGARQFWLSPDLLGSLPVTYMFDRNGRLKSRVVGVHDESIYEEQISRVIAAK